MFCNRLNGKCLLILFLAVSFCLEVRATGKVIDSSSVCSESGVARNEEIDFVKRWVAAITKDGKTEGLKDPWMDKWVSTNIPFAFNYSGEKSDSFLGNWQFKTAESQEISHGEQQQLVWENVEKGLKLTWTIKRITDYPAVEWLYTLENVGDKDSPLIEDIQSLSLNFKNSAPQQRYTVHAAHGGRDRIDDFMPFSTELSPAEGENELLLGTTGANPEPWFYAYHSSNNHLPFFNIETAEKRGVLVGVGWTGQWLAKIRSDETGLNVQVGYKESKLALHPGEKIRSPKTLLVFWQGERLHGHNMLRQILHKYYIPTLDGKPQFPQVTANTAFTYPDDTDVIRDGVFLYGGEKEILPLVEPFVNIGIESFIIDAGWWKCDRNYNNNIGSYEPDADRYPNGFSLISKALKKANVRFGLWIPPETIDPTLPFAKENPELVEDNHWNLGPWRLKMERHEARERILQSIDNLVSTGGMDFYRQDFYTIFKGDPEGRKGMKEIECITGLYKVLDDIRQQHPTMVMEGCCGGGRRIDFETVSRYHWHQKSDRWYDSVSDQCGLYGANLYLPGGLINLPTRAMDDFGVWSSFAGQLCLAWYPLDENFPMEQAKRQVALYKRIRHLLSGDFYPLTECSLKGAWLGYQFHRTDLNEGFALVFKRNNLGDEFDLSLRGLTGNKKYALHLAGKNEDAVYSGDELMKGIKIKITKVPGAELIIYRADN